MKRQVTFRNNQIEIAGELYLPTDFDEAVAYPALVCAHPAGSVKEQSPASYAGKLADKGFIVLTYDASHQGASGGEPRFLENPFERVTMREAHEYYRTPRAQHPNSPNKVMFTSLVS